MRSSVRLRFEYFDSLQNCKTRQNRWSHRESVDDTKQHWNQTSLRADQGWGAARQESLSIVDKSLWTVPEAIEAINEKAWRFNVSSKSEDAKSTDRKTSRHQIESKSPVTISEWDRCWSGHWGWEGRARVVSSEQKKKYYGSCDSPSIRTTRTQRWWQTSWNANWKEMDSTKWYSRTFVAFLLTSK